ncbi:MAG: hypothetical protein GEU91_10895 [Rhizobiales bacterium]|nr:hypothetical protein [Hyphomicrobiales bacterium]
MTNQQDTPERPEIEYLLPWHAAGTLNRREAEQVEAALKRDPELMRRYMIACEEMTATVDVNESLGVPSSRAMNRLFAAIDAEGGRKPARSAGLGSQISEFFASLTPRQLAFSAGAAVLAILLQAGLIGALVIGERSQGNYQTASTDKPAEMGSLAIVRFASNASAGDIAAVLEANRASIVDGPRPGGLYRIRIAALPPDASGQETMYRGTTDRPSAREARDRAIARLEAATNVINFIVPAE